MRSTRSTRRAGSAGCPGAWGAEVVTRRARALPQTVMLGMVVWAGAVAGAPGGLFGQEAPPLPGPPPELSIPGVQEAALPNGARVLLVPGGEVPLVSVTLVIPSGSATDPVGRAGVAELVARLLGTGPPAPAAADLSAELAVLGASLSATAAPDFLRIDLRGPAASLGAGADLMAGAVVAPTFPAEAVEAARAEILPALQSRRRQPSLVADGHFLAEVYGSHPYGRQPSPASLRAVSRDDLVAWHGTHVRPQGAFFVVAGGVTLDEVIGALTPAFAGWRPGSPPPRTRGMAENRASPEVVIIDRPGAATAHVRVGHLLPRGSHPDWPALRLAVRLLGGGPGSRLDAGLRSEPARTSDAFATVGRRAGRGYLRAGFSAPSARAADVLGELWAEMERLRDQLVPVQELDRVRTRLLGEQILALETPEQVAHHLARDQVLGMGQDGGGEFRSGVAALTPAGLRRAVRSHIRPREAVVVVVGDAGELRESLEAFGPVRVMDDRAAAVDEPAAGPVRASQDFSGAGLEALTARYRIHVQGREAGTSTRTLEPVSDTLLRFASRASLGPQEVEQSVTVRTRDLVFVSSEIRVRSMGQELTGALRRRGDRITGTLRSPAGDTGIDVVAGEDVLVSDMLELALWVADLEVGRVVTVPVLNVLSGQVETVHLRVVERADDILGADGSRLPEVFVVEVDSWDPQTLYARVEAPHVVLLLQPASQPVDVFLTSLTPGVREAGEGSGRGPGGDGAGAWSGGGEGP